MSLLISCQNVAKSYGSRDLFTDLSLSIFSQDRIGLIGPNGSGKSTLLKMICGLEKPDSGTITIRKNLKLGYVEQVCRFPSKTTYEILWDSLEEEKTLSENEKDHRIREWLGNLGFMGDEPKADLLSGGWKKRLAIARELIREPDLLILDEPTNHLDLEGLLWIERFLDRKVSTYLLVSHDRYFLENSVDKVMEISSAYPEGIFTVDGAYDKFLEKKEEFLKGQIQQERSLASKARREKEWLLQSPKARTTKSQSRVDGAHHILEQLSQIKKRNTQKTFEISFTDTKRQTRKLLVGKNLSKKMGDKILFQGLDLLLSPGIRIGLLGPNGSGKTTLLKMMAGLILPDTGTIKRAEDLKVVYFDQHRALLPDHLTLREALSPRGDFVTYQGNKIHVNGWCKKFLFLPETLDMPISKLSGGERARISIAHLLLEEADLLLLDEPTNDLDIPTLETLEESLLDFSGAVILITHDRCMIDRICNRVISLKDSQEPQIFADYNQWESSQKEKKENSKTALQEKSLPKASMTYLEKKEYEQMEEKIAQLEKELKGLHQQLEKVEMAKDPERFGELCTTLAETQKKIDLFFCRWEELDQKKSS